jgi:hypothetical protein
MTDKRHPVQTLVYFGNLQPSIKGQNHVPNATTTKLSCHEASTCPHSHTKKGGEGEEGVIRQTCSSILNRCIYNRHRIDAVAKCHLVGIIIFLDLD